MATTRPSTPWLLGIALLVILLFIFWNPLKKWIKGEKSVTETETTTTTTVECDETSRVTIFMTGEEIRALIEDNSRLEAERDQLRERLDDCLGNKKPKSTTTTKKKTTTKTTAPQKSTSERTQTQTPKATHSRETSPNLATNQYEGQILGDYGSTFDENSYLLFYIKASLLKDVKNRSTSEVRLNSKTGPVGVQHGEYIIFTTRIIILTDMIDNPWNFALYIGDHVQYGFDMWAPHELVKLNTELESDPQIAPNDAGGYHFVTYVNYRMK
ncbi:hypothetical protein CVU83_00845 [Candidatus Falkowbacteria bacterium HGW-Falkowbacteria-2]|uniref:Uncharacterized protein n=1 Tax=Candidatus Falkowbacteria bacterium HGW-Falkowbacteria-2 TaxID=2013769 RepID=A0A2N2E2L4_9BACT|nr:MAG: hypothetical protein CVU83_00845 [Candidatus Falkowbacteria bacterium HGW-Falkowbacteria-2]